MTQFSIEVPFELPNAPANWFDRVSGSSKIGDSTAIGFVLLAEFRVIAFARDAKRPTADPELIAPLEIGVTEEHVAFFAALVMLVIPWGLLYLFGRFRGVPGRHDPILPLISTQAGMASLSQLQILMWTFVIGGSAVYVMILSGNLIPITKGMLVLLGISGGAILGSNLDAKRQAGGTPAAAAKALALPGAIAGLRLNGTPDASDARL